MPLRRLILLIVALLLLGLFLWAAVNINRKSEIASFTTSMEFLDEDQVENLELAAARIDGYIIKPGEVFSFNEVVGDRLKSWGYKGAPTILQGKLVDTPGGGLCQLSSTVYNAALLSGMEILERTPHLWVINSVGPGQDAAILYGENASIDLKFRNPYEYPVQLDIDFTAQRVIAGILSPQEPGTDISLDVQVLQVFPAPRYPNYPGEGDPVRSNMGKSGKDGYRVKVFRVFKKDGKVTKKELVSVDKYEPIPGIIGR